MLFPYADFEMLHWEFQCNFTNFENILEIPLTFIKQTYLTCSIWCGPCFKPARKQLERVKLQMEIQKETSEIRRKQLEKRMKMAGKAGGRSGLAKNPKKMKTKQEKDDDDLLDDLVLETDPDKWQMSYSTLEPGGFMTKGADRKTQLDQRQARIVAVAGEPNDGDKESTEQERLEREASELSSQLKKVERAEAQVHDKDQ